MLSWFIRTRLAAFEKRYGYDVGYVRALLATDRRAFFAYARMSGLSNYRRDVPRDLYFATKLTSTLAADCGPCAQLVVAMALEAGVDARTVTSILGGDDTAMTADVRLGAQFARAVLAHDVAADELRDEIVRRWGQRAVISLAFAIAAAGMYPTIKYALGHGHACTRVVVGDQIVVPGARAAMIRRLA